MSQCCQCPSPSSINVNIFCCVYSNTSFTYLPALHEHYNELTSTFVVISIGFFKGTVSPAKLFIATMWVFSSLNLTKWMPPNNFFRCDCKKNSKSKWHNFIILFFIYTLRYTLNNSALQPFYIPSFAVLIFRSYVDYPPRCNNQHLYQHISLSPRVNLLSERGRKTKLVVISNIS